MIWGSVISQCATDLRAHLEIHVHSAQCRSVNGVLLIGVIERSI